MRTRRDVIEEYSIALGKENGNIATATILYKKLEKLFSDKCGINEEMKTRCIAEEIDNIICAYMISGGLEGGAV